MTEEQQREWDGRERRLRPPRSAEPLWLQVLYKFGVPSAIAIYLVWFMSNTVAPGVKAIEIKLDQHIEMNRAAAEQTQNLLRRQEAQQDIVIDLLKQTCVQNGKSSEDRRACYDASRR